MDTIALLKEARRHVPLPVCKGRRDWRIWDFSFPTKIEARLARHDLIVSRMAEKAQWGFDSVFMYRDAFPLEIRQALYRRYVAEGM